jgi:hypothetical protein
MPDRFTVQEHSTNGTVVGTLAMGAFNGDPLSCTIVCGNQAGTFAIDNSG